MKLSHILKNKEHHPFIPSPPVRRAGSFEEGKSRCDVKMCRDGEVDNYVEA